jgi:hypothetical protein
MIRRTDTFISQPISTSIEPVEVETQQAENRTSTALEQPATSNQGGATQISEFNLQEQTTQALLQNQLADRAPGQITKDPDDRPKVIQDPPEVIHRPTRFPDGPPIDPGPAPAPIVKTTDLSLNSSGPEVNWIQIHKITSAQN